MYSLRRLSTILGQNVVGKQNRTLFHVLETSSVRPVSDRRKYRLFYTSIYYKCNETPKPLRSAKGKASKNASQYFTDIKQVRTVGGNGGDGEISFLQLYINDKAGPDGGDGGNGGHVVFQVSTDVKDLSHIGNIIKAEDGEKGQTKDCFGKNANHSIVKVPIGTMVRSTSGTILADLNQEGMMFIAARGGAGGHGNAFFTSDTRQAPRISEYGGLGEDQQYVLELTSMAHFGLLGMPNAGKSTLLRAISRARPKVAAYPFTTLRPHIGMILYDDYEQVAVADLPGLIEDSHKNKGLGIRFLKHVERCTALIYMLDASANAPWEDFKILRNEITQFNEKLNNRPLLIIANKMDLPEAEENLKLLKGNINFPIIPISAKTGNNVSVLLKEIRILYDSVKGDSAGE